MEFERGQVYFLREDSSFGSEMATGRPILVVSSQSHLDGLPTLVGVSLSHTPRNWSSVVKVRVGRKWSYAICNQVKTLDKGRFNEKEFICKLTDNEMQQVDEALKDVLGLVVENIPVCEAPVVESEDNEVVESKEDEVAALKMELEIQKKLYDKAIEMLVALKFDKDTSVEVVKEPVVEEVTPVVEPTESVVEESPKPKRGRPPKQKVGEVVVAKKPPYNARKSDIEIYKKPSGKVNINTDDWYEISATTGMRSTTAQAIVAHRNKHGKFADLVDLLDVRQFGATMLDKYGRMLEV